MSKLLAGSTIGFVLFLWLLNIAFWGGLIFAAIHFIHKFW